jgi:hypothetical protein
VKSDARPDLEGKASLELSDVSGDGACCRTHDAGSEKTAAACC